MKRQFLILFALSAALVSMPMKSAFAEGHGNGGGSRGHSVGNSHGGARSHGLGRGFGGIGHGFSALGVGGDYEYGWDIADLYRQLYQNLPYFALHPPVYYSYPVPRTYGYSPFAYPPGTLTPDVAGEPQPVTIDNPYVPSTKPATTDAKSPDRSAATSKAPEPLVIVNPFVTPASNVAKGG